MKFKPAYLFAVLLLAACSKGPQPLDFGNDTCSYCKMTISDKRFGAELITGKGKVFRFDSPECMVGIIHNKTLQEEQVAQYLVVDATQEGKLIDARTAFYLHSDDFPSPMRGNISAYETTERRDMVKKEHPGIELTWDQAKERLSR